MLMSLYNDTVINKVAETSALLRRSLTQEHLKAFITLHYITLYLLPISAFVLLCIETYILMSVKDVVIKKELQRPVHY